MALSCKHSRDVSNSRFNADLEGLVRSAHQSFEILELWQKEKSPDPQPIESMIEKILRQSPKYYSAVQKSADTAEKRCSFASDAIALCDRLAKNDIEDPISSSKCGLQDIMLVANYAHEDSQEMILMFEEVQRELLEIANDIPTQYATDKSESLSRASSTEGDDISRDTTFTSIEETTTTSLQLHHATNDLNALIQHVTCFVDWWADSNTVLASLDIGLPQITVDSSSSFRIKAVKETWVEVYDKHLSYQRQISEIGDYYRNLSEDSQST